MFLLSSADFFQNLLFQKILLGTLVYPSVKWFGDQDCHSVRVQTVCKGYQHAAKIAASKEIFYPIKDSTLCT